MDETRIQKMQIPALQQISQGMAFSKNERDKHHDAIDEPTQLQFQNL